MATNSRIRINLLGTFSAVLFLPMIWAGLKAPDIGSFNLLLCLLAPVALVLLFTSKRQPISLVLSVLTLSALIFSGYVSPNLEQAGLYINSAYAALAGLMLALAGLRASPRARKRVPQLLVIASWVCLWQIATQSTSVLPKYFALQSDFTVETLFVFMLSASWIVIGNFRVSKIWQGTHILGLCIATALIGHIAWATIVGLVIALLLGGPQIKRALERAKNLAQPLTVFQGALAAIVTLCAIASVMATEFALARLKWAISQASIFEIPQQLGASLWEYFPQRSFADRAFDGKTGFSDWALLAGDFGWAGFLAIAALGFALVFKGARQLQGSQSNRARYALAGATLILAGAGLPVLQTPVNAMLLGMLLVMGGRVHAKSTKFYIVGPYLIGLCLSAGALVQPMWYTLDYLSASKTAEQRQSALSKNSVTHVANSSKSARPYLILAQNSEIDLMNPGLSDDDKEINILKVVQIYQVAQSIDPTCADCFVAMGRIDEQHFRGLGSIYAQQAYEAALEIDPFSTTANKALLSLLTYQKNSKAIEKQLDKLSRKKASSEFIESVKP